MTVYSRIRAVFFDLQTNDKLEVLNDVLIGRVRSYYLCSLCQDTFIYPSSPIDQILIFKSSSGDRFLAHSILPDVDDENDSTERYSTCCNPSAINNNMQVYKQLFIKCPSCLIVSLSKIWFFSFHNYQEWLWLSNSSNLWNTEIVRVIKND